MGCMPHSERNAKGVPCANGFQRHWVFRPIPFPEPDWSSLLLQVAEGAGRQARLTLGPDGNLYGTTTHGGLGGGGTIFRIVLTPRLAAVARLANGSRLISGTGPAGSPFRLRASTDVSRPFADWPLLTTGIFANDGTFSFTDTAAATLPQRFYRLTTP